MRKLLIILALFTFIGNMFAQDVVEKRKLEFHSIGFSPLSFYTSNRDGGVALSIELAANYGEHVFKLYGGTGSEMTINIWGTPISDTYTEWSLMYGREFQAGKDYVFFDVFAGIGYFNFTYDKGATEDIYPNYNYPSDPNLYYPREIEKGVVSIPIDLKLRFKTGRIFSLGVQVHANFNSATTIVQPGIFLQWKL